MVEISASWVLSGILAVLVVLLLSTRNLQVDSSHNNASASYSESEIVPKNIVEKEEDSATSGHLFSGNHLKYKGPLLFNTYKTTSELLPSIEIVPGAQFCPKWGVVTTIFPPTDAVYKMARLHGWCLVVVGDKKSPLQYFDNSTNNFHHAVYLDVLAQEELSKYLEIIIHLPWNHFGRKNVGYLYAVMHGAREIFDFDDDNELLSNNTHLSTLHSSGHQIRCRTTTTEYSAPVLNPYPLMGAVPAVTWPRGYPLERIKFNYSSTTHPIKLVDIQLASENISIIQFLANHDPDVDAIFRLTHPLPFDFEPSHPPLLIPNNSFSPYNAQATLHYYNALWSLYLPVTVHGRVSDIWRGYATQRLLRDFGGELLFMSPIVAQFRNAHNYLADFQSEEPLYMRTTQLVEDLFMWHSNLPTFPGRLEALWVMLFERGYIGLADVSLMQHWIKDLINLKYAFPAVV